MILPAKYFDFMIMNTIPWSISLRLFYVLLAFRVSNELWWLGENKTIVPIGITIHKKSTSVHFTFLWFCIIVAYIKL